MRVAWLPRIKLRALLLAKAGIPPRVIDMPLPKPVGRADCVDALAALVVARELPMARQFRFLRRPSSIGWNSQSQFLLDRRSSVVALAFATAASPTARFGHRRGPKGSNCGDGRPSNTVPISPGDCLPCAIVRTLADVGNAGDARDA